MSGAVGQRLELERRRLAELERERGRLRASIRVLERQVAAGSLVTAELERGTPREQESRAGSVSVATAEGRVAVFAGLFRGRPDVFATRWESRSGRSGWSPRCANEWVRGVCEKPRVKCAACAHQRFVAFCEREVRWHLEGRQVMGIYPLLADETCWLVAIDLDGPAWRDDASAVLEAAAGMDVPMLVERSRSGDGAHVWVLFSQPVPARTARAVASWLLTEAMRRRPLSLGSYDRLFPNQDTMPAGGFGNLIALPLQRQARERGCTVFLDDVLEPHEDQWVYLAGVRRLDARRADELASAAESDGRGLGLRDWHDGRSALATPLPAADAQGQGRGPPRVVPARLGGRVELSLDRLPAGLVDRLRRTAAFANPTFYERERARLSTHRTPRVIACHDQVGGRLLLPRGCLHAAEAELAAAGAELDLTDCRADGTDANVAFHGDLSGAQEVAVREMAAREIGVLVAPPGAGKTVMAASLIARRDRSTLVLVHRRPLLDQWMKRLSRFLALDPADVGVIAGGKNGATGRIDVAMVQSLVRRQDAAELLTGYGHVVVDECHHVPAVSVERVLRLAPARFVTGLTATPRRRDGHDPIIAMQCGPVRHTISQTQVDRHAVRRVLIERRTGFDPTVLPPEPGIQEVLGAIASASERTNLIARDTIAAVSEGRAPLVLTERREHLHAIAAALEGAVPCVVVLHGGMGVRARCAAATALAAEGPRVVLATGRYIGEGFDEPRLDTLMLAMPIAWTGTLTQYVGRLHRDHSDKQDVRILDYVDYDVPVLRRMFAKRQRAYRSLGYQPG